MKMFGKPSISALLRGHSVLACCLLVKGEKPNRASRVMLALCRIFCSDTKSFLLISFPLHTLQLIKICSQRWEDFLNPILYVCRALMINMCWLL